MTTKYAAPSHVCHRKMHGRLYPQNKKTAESMIDIIFKVSHFNKLLQDTKISLCKARQEL